MADLNNLLGELDNDEDQRLSDGYDDGEAGGEPNANETQEEAEENAAYSSSSTGRAELPAALQEAESLRHTAAASAAARRADEDRYGGYGEDLEPFDGEGGVGKDHQPGNAAAADDDEADTDLEYEQLKSLWCQELMCPELLPHDVETVGLHTELLRGQEDTVEELQQRVASGGGGDGDAADPMLSSLAAGIYKMEADRVRFLLADLTRTRLAKIENHALHNRELVDRMSDEEVAYLKQYGGLAERHLQRTVLNSLPKEAWRKLNEPDMIDTPDLDAYVFCKVLETVEIDSSVGDKKKSGSGIDDDDDDDDDMGGSIQEHAAGSFLIARYAAIRGQVLEGKLALLV
mmetsp:Transcript_12094/g.26879  ORF Transcript_12094/g.26879 Transcript_12094/m.26879 type:complete len:346 (+) Transcript_12094:82-1119(+)